jgi:hypothetical protein
MAKEPSRYGGPLRHFALGTLVGVRLLFLASAIQLGGLPAPAASAGQAFQTEMAQSAPLRRKARQISHIHISLVPCWIFVLTGSESEQMNHTILIQLL